MTWYIPITILWLLGWWKKLVAVALTALLACLIEKPLEWCVRTSRAIVTDRNLAFRICLYKYWLTHDTLPGHRASVKSGSIVSVIGSIHTQLRYPPRDQDRCRKRFHCKFDRQCTDSLRSPPWPLTSGKVHHKFINSVRTRLRYFTTPDCWGKRLHRNFVGPVLTRVRCNPTTDCWEKRILRETVGSSRVLTTLFLSPDYCKSGLIVLLGGSLII